MNLALATLAVLTTTPVVRGRLAVGTAPPPQVRHASLALLTALCVMSVLVGPAVAAATEVSGPTARIAAGLVITVTSVPDLWRRPVVARPTHPPWRAGLVPVGFPELFGPPLAAALVAAAVDRGVAVAVGLTGLAVISVAAAQWAPGPRTVGGPARSLAGVRAAAAVGTGVALVMNGVLDI